ncbi:hypothetical protein GWI34_38185 [Actinomadura sp. DSM 109109]|nr:hypothetical protein [Actinomadura lepetitiana]
MADPRIEPFDSGAVVTLAGELDAFDAPGLREAFHSLMETSPGVIVLDLSTGTVRVDRGGLTCLGP